MDMEKENAMPEAEENKSLISEDVQPKAELPKSVEETTESNDAEADAETTGSDMTIEHESVDVAPTADAIQEEANAPDPPESEEEPVFPTAEINNIVHEATVAETNPKEEPASEDTNVTDDTKPSSADHHDDHQHEEIDFENLSKKELVDLIVKLKEENDMRRVDRMLKEVRPRFDEFYNGAKEEALKAFLAVDGNEEGDFNFRGDELDERFFDYYDLLKDKCKSYYHELEKQRDDNLKKKTEILDKIRELVDGEESNTSMGAIRQLQDEWKSAGPVPGNQHRILWANYNALLDRFYDARSIYFELKELDRKKNLEAKHELCHKVELLDKEANIRDAIAQLNEIHDEFKHIGPVPREDQEELWQKFKTASDLIYAKRKIFVEDLKKELHQNLETKIKISEEVHEFENFKSDKISDWNKKTKDVLNLQKKWDAVGGLPREKAKDINKKFWSAFKKFFANKSEFFKELESHRDENLKLKEELIVQAESLKESQEWEKVAEEFKKLQQKWRDIGPVPEKKSNEVFKRFKAAGDYFFDQRRAQNQVQNQEFEKNLEEKLAICESLTTLVGSESIDLNQVHDLIGRFHELGFVPRNAIKKVKSKYDAAVQAVLDSGKLTDADLLELKSILMMSRLKSTPGGDRQLARQENSLRRKITSLENDIGTWKTNIEFFASSKTADKLKAEFEEKLNKSIDELDELKAQLRMIRNA